MIRFQLGRGGKPSSPEVRRAWRLISEAWATKQDEDNTPWFELRASIALDGWSPAAARQLAATHLPYLAVKRPFSGSPKPPALENPNIDDILVLDVEYPQIDMDIEIPDSMVLAVTREFRRNVEHAVALESETGGYALSRIAPIEADPGLERASSQREFDLSQCVLFYAGLYKRLAKLSPTAAKHEHNAWPEDDTVFVRLRIWACTLTSVLTDTEAGQLLSGLPDSVFWGGTHQRDLLLSLRKRWASIPREFAMAIEARLLAGPPTEGANDPDIVQRRAWFSLSRITWLHNEGCQFTFNFEAESARFRTLAPKWQPEYAERAARSLESQAGYVRTDTAFDSLLSVPLADLLTRAQELSGYRREGFVQGDPFAGMVDARPVRAFRALIYSAKHKDYPEWAWTTFLAPQARAKDRPRLTCAIAQRVSRLPASVIGKLAHAISAWLQAASTALATRCPAGLEIVWSSLITALGASPADGQSTVVRRKDREPEWVTEALNSPVGKLTQMLMEDARATGLQPMDEIPPSWLRAVEHLLSLQAPARQHTLAILARNLNWFDARAPKWTDQHLIAPLDADASDRCAIWAGYFWGNCTPAKSLYEKLKANMKALIESRAVTRHEHLGFLAAMLLDGWQRIELAYAPRSVSDSEMREMLLKGGDPFRAQTVWHLQQWIKGTDERSQAWAHLLPELLKEVWPRHKDAKSPRTSARLCDLALSDPRLFPRVADIVTDLVAKVSDQHLILTNLQDEGSVIIKLHPTQVLALLSVILPEDVSKWPYGIEGILNSLQQANAALLNDDRLIELKRRLATG